MKILNNIKNGVAMVDEAYPLSPMQQGDAFALGPKRNGVETLVNDGRMSTP